MIILRRLVRPAIIFSIILACLSPARSAPVHLVEEAPVQITNVAPGVFLVDFGRVAFGNLKLTPLANATGKVTVDFGEAMENGRINRNPPGSVRYAEAEAMLDGAKPLVVAPEANERNTKQPVAVLTPPEWGVVLPFRWVEITGWTGELRADQLRRQAAFSSTWNDNASSFHSSDETLNQIWELCRYSIKAMTFAGVYVDGDRERIAYEADAYLTQLSQFYAEGDVQMARDTVDRLLQQPTWPTEWAAHVIFMAHADWMQTGDTNWLASRYAAIRQKLQIEFTQRNGLVVSSKAKVKRGDVIDWPEGERDGFVFTPLNTVENAFYLRTLTYMTELARVLHHPADADEFAAREATARRVFQKTFFDPASGLYRDGQSTPHTSLHANLFPLAFDLVPANYRPHIVHWLGERGMACSVYAAQYLMEGLFENGGATNAIELMLASNDRSWRHMVESGTTITWEAWDQHYKPNQDWNHAWGAAPANLLPRYVLGAQPLAPGWTRAIIRPNPGPLKMAEGKIPTPLGPVQIHWENGDIFKLTLTLPPGMTGQVRLPASKNGKGVFQDGQSLTAHRDGAWWIVDKDVAGTGSFEVR